MYRETIFTREFWRGFALDIWRSGREKRARKGLLYRAAFLVYLAAVLAYYGTTFYSFHDPVTAIGLAVALMLILAIVGAVRFSQYREQQRLLAEDIASAPTETVRRLQNLAHSLAAIDERALGEVWLIKNTVPDGHSVITRRIGIDSLRKLGIWDNLPVDVRNWMMRPDGTWPQERIARVLASAEILHSLLWALGLLPRLRPLDALVEPLDFRKLSRALQKPAPGLRPTWDIRVERNKAHEYFIRCYAENIHRGEIEAANAEQQDAVEEWMGKIATGDASDHLAGAQTISEVQATTLDMVWRSAHHRNQTLQLVMDLLDGKDVWQELADTLYAPFHETPVAASEAAAEA